MALAVLEMREFLQQCWMYTGLLLTYETIADEFILGSSFPHCASQWIGCSIQVWIQTLGRGGQVSRDRSPERAFEVSSGEPDSKSLLAIIIAYSSHRMNDCLKTDKKLTATQFNADVSLNRRMR
jgi:hypothetical protein